MSKAIVLDTETTGLAPATSRITELAIVDFESGSLLFKSYFDPECPIPEKITEITGITDETVRGQPLFRHKAAEIHGLIQSASAILGWNPLFDKGMIAAEFERLGDLLTPPRWPILVDGKRIWDVYEPREERHLMNGFKRFVNRRGFEGAHGTLQDTNATREVILAQVDVFGLRGDDGKVIPWEDMDPERKLWWGPSPHILRIDGRLMMNFGKHKGTPVLEVEVGMFRWIKERDFPDHVIMIAIKMVDGINPTELLPWADRYAVEKCW